MNYSWPAAVQGETARRFFEQTEKAKSVETRDVEHQVRETSKGGLKRNLKDTRTGERHKRTWRQLRKMYKL